MMRRIAGLSVTLLILIGLVSFPENVSAKQVISIRDMGGRSVEVPVKPARIICLGPGALRLLSYLGVQDRVVGIEKFEKTLPVGRPYRLANPALTKLPVIGPGGPAAINKDPDLEAVLAVKPDLIFVTNMEVAKADNLQRKLRMPVVLLSYGRFAGFDETVFDSLRLAARIVDAEKRAGEIVFYIEKSRKELMGRTSGVAKAAAPQVYVGGIGFKGSQGIESTDAEYIPLDWIGAKNAARSLGGKNHFFADRERLLALNPDTVFIDAGGLALVLQDFKKKPDFYRALKAFKTSRVCVLYPFNHYATNIESALADAYAAGKVLYSRTFEDVDPGKKADDIFQFFVRAPVNSRMEKDFGRLGRKLALPD